MYCGTLPPGASLTYALLALQSTNPRHRLPDQFVDGTPHRRYGFYCGLLWKRTVYETFTASLKVYVSFSPCNNTDTGAYNLFEQNLDSVAAHAPLNELSVDL